MRCFKTNFVAITFFNGTFGTFAVGWNEIRWIADAARAVDTSIERAKVLTKTTSCGACDQRHCGFAKRVSSHHYRFVLNIAGVGCSVLRREISVFAGLDGDRLCSGRAVARVEGESGW